MICPRCADEHIEVMANSPVKGVWTVYQCQHCLYTWWIGPYISIHFLSLNPLLVRRRRYSRGERYPSALCGCHSL